MEIQSSDGLKHHSNQLGFIKKKNFPKGKIFRGGISEFQS